ncbi:MULTISPECIES: 2-oxo-4-hydroxy-4-carboxy-5-ureidoimidazoline decarboxylase [unclassified Mycolicibacterium]|jgi:2-oxo-4-hydroxy-4-carboxy-5-ureidoimidazoline decarboxylase|uniref:2-oxo-4-hydroxy-4-carboxy-5-ureidoimidazoline decarboxylase n=1 Tax=unclassified Mycolicibacterium TaxID=2636767 RepID=UPI001F4BD88B|nr:2-oxo-4-hydroxy-4-carboxy-5-ureidoimidazoline decarboxylase [Mycolicibacterium sp. YH-1]UNB53343.1 2-oxo-4-hydroxy-4-carboxy-5-ureidoimidazoline decarboxylase [Mycolicibacterium sp. YH-1]HET7742166.1 2-oxo-4-hydroxy-4-carboxy-5-ureidoimidazoline decarboxylase [Mycobacterium sp.]
MYQGVGLDAFNAWPERRAAYALYECANCLRLSRDLARGRPYPDHATLFRQADALLFAMPEAAIDQILEACPDVGRRPRSPRSRAEQCSVWDDDTAVMAALSSAAGAYAQRFGFGFVMFVNGLCAADVTASVIDRMHNDLETERKVVRNELAKVNRSRLERMLGPEGGYHNW